MTRHSSFLRPSLCVALLALAGCAPESEPAAVDTAPAAPAIAKTRALAPPDDPPGPSAPALEQRQPRPDAAQIVAARVDLPRWDGDRDGLINPAEFAHGLFAIADVDGDERLTAAEFEAARAWLPGEPDPATIARWDWDADGQLDPRAFVSGVITDQLARGWDRDGDHRLRRSEIAAGLTDAFDRDDDGTIEPGEQAAIAEPAR